MTPRRHNRRWSRLAVGLVGLVGLLGAGLLWAGPAPDVTAAPAAASLNWSTVSLALNPPPLAYASAVYDSDNQTVVLFGGMLANGTLSNETWVWNGSSWAEIPGVGIEAPPRRDKATMAFDPALHELILFGGEGVSGQLLDDTWAWNGASWYEESDQSNSPGPSAREGAALAYDGSGQLVLFGGLGPAPASPATDPPATDPPATDPPATDLPAAATSGETISPGAGAAPGSGPPISTAPTSAPPASTSAVTGLSSGPEAPASTGSPRADASGSALAATGPLISLGDTWLWSSTGWRKASGTEPGPRSDAAMAFDPGRGEAILFGGQSTQPTSGSPAWLNNTWAWGGRGWTALKTPGAPSGRGGATLTPDGVGNDLILFGGFGAAGAQGDTWLWNGRSWARPTTTGAPTPRAGAAAAFDSVTSQLTLFGGVGATGAILGDTVILAQQAPLALGPGNGAAATSQPPSAQAGASNSPPPSNGAAGTTGPVGVAPAAVAHPSPSSTTPTPPAPALHRGELVKLSGRGFKPGVAVTITFHSTPVVVGKVTADARGSFSATVAIPQLAAAGTHHFDATGQGPGGELDELIATVKVVGGPGSSTTSSLQKAVLTGIALLIPLATWFVLAGTGWRRRRRVSAS